MQMLLGIVWVQRQLNTTETFFIYENNFYKHKRTAKNNVISPNFLVWAFCGKL